MRRRRLLIDPEMEKRDFLATHPLFRGLPAQARERLASFAKVRPMAARETLFRRGDAGDSMLAVVAGAVSISLPGAEGRDRTLAIYRDGDIFGEIALLDGKPRTADAIAISEGRLLRFDRRDVLPILRATPEMTEVLLQLLCARLRRTSDQVEEQSFLDLAARLARAILRLTEANAVVASTQRELAELIGASRESTNRKLGEWDDAGWIALRKGGLAVRDRERLESIAVGDEGV
jgi:CRP-like cAMP-binding protein